MSRQPQATDRMGRVLREGDPVQGTNRWTGDKVRGEVDTLDQSPLDGLWYAEVIEWTGARRGILAADLFGPRPCNRPTDPDGTGRCQRCGRRVYANGPYDTDRLTHDLSRVPGRYQ